MASNKRKREKRQYGNAKKRAESHTSGFTATSIQLPEGMNFFTVKKAGTVKLDIVPYIAGEGNEHADAGELYYERTYYTHRGIGVDENTYVCPRKTFGKKCPVCEDLAKLRRDPKADEELVKELEPKERQLFLVIDRADEDKGVQLWDISYHLFGKMLDNYIKMGEEDDRYEDFFHLEDGKTLRVSFAEESFGGRTFYKCSGIDMKDRKEPLDDSLPDEVPCLDELLVEKDYDELKKIYLQEEDDEDGDEPAPKKGAKKKPADDDDEPDDEDEDEDEPPAKKVTKKATAKKKVEEDEPDDDEDEDEDEPAPKKAGKKGAAKKKADDEEEGWDDDEDEPDEDDEEEGWDDDEDEPPAKKGGKKK